MPGTPLAPVLDAATTALTNGSCLTVENCPKCRLSVVACAKVYAKQYDCTACGAQWKRRSTAVANPLAALLPVLRDGTLYVGTLPSVAFGFLGQLEHSTIMPEFME